MTKTIRTSIALLLFTVTGFLAQSQEFKISGRIVDTSTKEPLEAATVFAEAVKDSSLVVYSITDAKGRFELEGKTAFKKINLIVSFVGFKSYNQVIDLSSQREYDLKEIVLSSATEDLNEVLVVGRTPPIRFKQDTTEFNVASFDTKKDANVEDLLKKLPGFEVDENGAVTVNGIPVNKVLVNGKPFFGNDPTIATRNLTKDIVEKIQVVDSRTRTQAFTGEQSDGENKTVNIKIAKDKNRGTFGRVAAGAGTGERFEYAGIANYFDDDLRLSVLGGGNNINRAGFNFGEVSSTFGRGAAWSITGGGNGGGITNSRVGGANYADDWGKSTNQATANYIYQASNTTQDRRSSAKSDIPERNPDTDELVYRTQFSESMSNSYSTNDRHRFNPEYETVIDSAYYIEIRPDFSYNESFNTSNSEEDTFDENREILNESEGFSSRTSLSRDFNNRLSVTRRYGSGGGYIRLDLNNSYSKNESNSSNQNEVIAYVPGTQGQVIDEENSLIRDQIIDGNQQNNNFYTRLRWKAPIVKDLFFFSAEYSYNQDLREDENFVFDQNRDGALDTEQSADFSNENFAHRPELGLEYRDEKLNVEVEGAFIFRELASNETITNVAFDNYFEALEVEVDLRYQFTKNTRLRFGYDLQNDIPNINQLSPYVDISNPTFIRTGNPDLDPTTQNRFNLNFNTYDVNKEANFYVYSNYSTSNNEIISNTINENGFRRSTFANVDGNYSFSTGSGYGKNFKLDSLSSVRLNVGMNFNLRQRQNLVNGTQFAASNESYGPRVDFNYTYSEMVSARIGYSPNFEYNKFENENQNDIYILRHEASADLRFTFGDLEFENVLNYNYNSNIQDGFQKGSLFWNSSVQYSILKDNGLITLRGYDVLKQNNNARRIVQGQGYVDVQSLILQRYFMLGFSYKFNTLGKKPPGYDRGGGRYGGRRY